MKTTSNFKLNHHCPHHSSDFASQSALRSVDIPPLLYTFSTTKPIPGNQIAPPTHLHIPCLSDLNILTAVNKTRITWLISGAWSKCAQIAQAGAGKEWKVNHLQLPPLQALVTYLSTEQSVTWSKGPHFQTAFSVGEAVSSPSVSAYR